MRAARLLFVAAVATTAAGAARLAIAQPAPAVISVSSPTLIAEQPVPRQHTPDGRNESPGLAWVVYALDAPIVERPNAPPMTRAELLDAARGHIIGRGELVATYERK